DRFHRRLELLHQVRSELLEQAVGLLLRQMAHLEIERAFARHDVERRAAADETGMYRRVRDVESTIVRAMLAKTQRHAPEIGDRFSSRFDGVHAARRVSRMCGKTLHDT